MTVYLPKNVLHMSVPPHPYLALHSNYFRVTHCISNYIICLFLGDRRERKAQDFGGKMRFSSWLRQLRKPGLFTQPRHFSLYDRTIADLMKAHTDRTWFCDSIFNLESKFWKPCEPDELECLGTKKVFLALGKISIWSWIMFAFKKPWKSQSVCVKPV